MGVLTLVLAKYTGRIEGALHQPPPIQPQPGQIARFACGEQIGRAAESRTAAAGGHVMSANRITIILAAARAKRRARISCQWET